MADFQFPVRLLYDDNRRIHVFATSDGDPSKQHDVDAHARIMQGNKSQQHSYWNRDYRNGRAWKMPEKNQDDDDNRENHLQQRCARVRDCTPHQFGAVIDWYDFDAVRQSRFDLLQSCLYPVNYIERVAALAHDDDSRDGLGHPGDRNPVGSQPVRVNIDLVLLCETAE